MLQYHGGKVSVVNNTYMYLHATTHTYFTCTCELECHIKFTITKERSTQSFYTNNTSLYVVVHTLERSNSMCASAVDDATH